MERDCGGKSAFSFVGESPEMAKTLTDAVQWIKWKWGRSAMKLDHRWSEYLSQEDLLCQLQGYLKNDSAIPVEFHIRGCNSTENIESLDEAISWVQGRKSRPERRRQDMLAEYGSFIGDTFIKP